MSFTLPRWTQADYADLVSHLTQLADEQYRIFHQKLIPNVNNMLGVRMPKLQKIAKEITKGNVEQYLSIAKNTTYEEVMLKGLVIGNCKADIATVLCYLNEFIPSINNWAVCDCVSGNLRITTKYKEQMFEFLKTYLNSDQEFELRFAIVMLMGYYIEDEYINQLLAIYDNMKHEGYYVKMAVAWALSVCYVKQEDITMQYLQNNNLDDFTFNKTLQKIIESNRVTKEQKAIVKLMKRKIKKKLPC